jgi:chorismate mutase-like protein
LLPALLLALSAQASEPLRVGTSGDYAPFSADGKGFEIDAAKLVGAELGREVVFVPFRWPELPQKVAAGEFDVAMSGVTWRADRAVVGRMSLGFAAGGPCWLGAPTPKSVAVNSGGVLERFAKTRFPNARLKVVEENRSLPDRFRRGEIEAIVTDSFEVVEWQRRLRAPSHCEPPRDLKVWWIAPQAADELGPKLDAFVRAREPDLEKLRERWFGAPQERDDADRVIDLTSRRLAFMPAVGAWKRDHGLEIEDPAQEARVLESMEARARELSLDPDAVRALFALQIELAKRIQTRAPAAASELDLERQLRPALADLSRRQLEALASDTPLDRELSADRLAPLGTWLEPGEVRELYAALRAVARPK